MSEQINLKAKSIVELKSMAYDLSKVINQYSQALNAINNEINVKEEEAQKIQQAMAGAKRADPPLPEETPKKGVKNKLTVV